MENCFYPFTWKIFVLHKEPLLTISMKRDKTKKKREKKLRWGLKEVFLQTY